MTELTATTLEWGEADEAIEITNLDVLAAMAETDPNEARETGNWYVGYNGQEYPLAHVVRRAIAHATGEERREFSTDHGVELLETLGFATRKLEL